MPDALISPGCGRGRCGPGPGQEEFKQGEQVGHTVLNRGAGEQNPSFRVSGMTSPWRCESLRFFKCWASSPMTQRNGMLFKYLQVPNQGAVRCDKEVVLPQYRFPPQSDYSHDEYRWRTQGRKRPASLFQFSSRVAGQTTK